MVGPHGAAFPPFCYGLSDTGVEDVLLRLRWPETSGKPVCPNRGCTICYVCRRSAGQMRWRCKACRRDVSITSGILSSRHKLPLRTYLLAVVVFCNEVKGKSMLALARDLEVQHKTAFVLAHKLREVVAASTRGLRVGGEGQAVEVDGACFGGHVRPQNRSGERRVVVAMRGRGDRILPQVFAGEGAAVPAIRRRIVRDMVAHADESPAWNPLHARFAMQRINHYRGGSIDGACANGAEAAFSRLRRAELGHHHPSAGPCLVRYPQEAA